MKFPRKVKEPVDINLAPLIDVVFILLLFFVVTTTFTRETQLKVDLPQAVSGTEAVEASPIEILIAQNGMYSVNGLTPPSNNLSGLMQLISEQATNDSQMSILLSADAAAPHQSVVTAMDAVAKLGISKLRITTVEAAVE